jgi:hypothetical protein
VSICTGVAQRVVLREVVAEVMLQMTDGWMEKPLEWQTLMSTGEGLFLELRKPTFRAWVETLDINAQHALSRSVSHILHKICWAGVNDAGKLVVACPQHGNSDACIHVPLTHTRALAWLLKDTERSATFACLTNACFTVTPWLDICQNTPHPRWKNRIPALITSVSQYQWLGADNWAKLPLADLQKGAVYWMGTSEDKRRVTVKALPGKCPARLIVSKSAARWRFLRRAWERIERVRQTPHIELRESSLTTEDHTQDVVVFRDLPETQAALKK